ncbi:hypothetical protein Tsubulata_003466 [Turnera subulata]|uniref:Alpha/beta hydrolase fold-3 domain-containing protein n=1 Tax=Turnera subulata TaxID=218843 RepID=A0A9Q0G9R2_9ROSI|nr:hypothetical protein Tsubulata_003466 [Turnera subulata]
MAKPEVTDGTDFSRFPLLYRDGTIQRLRGNEFVVPPSLDPDARVHSKNVIYSQEGNLSVRLYLPRNTNPGQNLPLVIYFHGGGFMLETAFSPTYHNYLNILVEEANVIAVSVDYRRAPEHAIPVPYDDAWTALEWVASHVNGNGPEEWLNSHADMSRVFFVGDSAGANMTHQMAIRYGQEKLLGVDLIGVVLVHPYFWGKEPIGNEPKDLETRGYIDCLWHFVCPASNGCDDPLINPSTDPKLASLGGTRVLVFVAEKDWLRDRGWYYYENLRNSGWEGLVEIVESKDEAHIFHLSKPNCDNAAAMMKNIVSFIYSDKP